MDRQATLEEAARKALRLAELCERKAALLRDMAEALAQERWPDRSAWHGSALDLMAGLERRAAQGKAATYQTEAGLVSCAYVAGRSAWTLAGSAIARRQAAGLIAERMAKRLG